MMNPRACCKRKKSCVSVLILASLGWRSPIQPIGAEDTGEEYDVLEAVENEPVLDSSHTLKAYLCQVRND